MAKRDQADKKTESILITNHKKNNIFNIQVGCYEIISKSIKYPAMTNDVKLSFKGHLVYSREKGAAANSS